MMQSRFIKLELDLSNKTKFSFFHPKLVKKKTPWSPNLLKKNYVEDDDNAKDEDTRELEGKPISLVSRSTQTNASVFDYDHRRKKFELVVEEPRVYVKSFDMIDKVINTDMPPFVEKLISKPSTNPKKRTKDNILSINKNADISLLNIQYAWSYEKKACYGIGISSNCLINLGI
ncbi:hypothetical protein BpHYR1_024473 [Brachionus plicatilis]|uniref:Uncharacterized protein n=1 Tax=Brachionus plicatilis TaxID=10195 RepID=A0A3M7Q7X4_BRAPC|nr:hypothetical protein BpHYR1_024473 [Brachionus plicatilis]